MNAKLQLKRLFGIFLILIAMSFVALLITTCSTFNGKAVARDKIQGVFICKKFTVIITADLVKVDKSEVIQPPATSNIEQPTDMSSKTTIKVMSLFEESQTDSSQDKSQPHQQQSDDIITYTIDEYQDNLLRFSVDIENKKTKKYLAVLTADRIFFEGQYLIRYVEQSQN